MTPGRRFLLFGLVVAAGELALAVAAIPTGLAPYLVACALATAALGLATHRLLDASHDDPGDGGDGGRGDGPDDDEPPPWWPDFEDAFRAHVQDRIPG